MAHPVPVLAIVVSLALAASASAFEGGVQLTRERSALDTTPMPTVELPGARLPRVIARGDFNGDFRMEVAVSTDDDEILFLDALALASGHLDASDILLTLRGGEAFPGFGHDMAAGDFNGDGIMDLLVGAPETGDADQGAAILLQGQRFRRRVATMRITPPVALVYLGEEPGARLGQAVHMADFNGDGLDDAAFSAPGRAGGVGRVAFLRGTPGAIPREVRDLTTVPPTGMIAPPPGATMFGWTLGSGNFDASPEQEVVIGGTSEVKGFLAVAGAAVPGTRVLDMNQNFLFTGGSIAEPLGADLDGDGTDELAALLPTRLFVVDDVAPGFGPAPIASLAAGVLETPFSFEFGKSLAAGDVDRDGRDEILLGMPGATFFGDRPAAGAAAVYDVEAMVPSGNALDSWRLLAIGEEAGNRLGSAVGVMDPDGDGWIELLMGSPGFLQPVMEGSIVSDEVTGKLYDLRGFRVGTVDLRIFSADGSFAP